MKRLKHIYLLALLPCLSSQVFAFGGGVVTDPNSYTYYAKQIEQAIEQVELAEEQVKQATKTYDKIVNVDKSLTGNLQRAQKNLERIKSLQDMSITDMRKSLQYAKKALDEVADIPEYKDDIESEIDKTFGEDNQGRNDWVNVEAEKNANKQRAYKQAVIDAEVAQGKLEMQHEQLEELAVATNQTDDLKDATDVTNAALLQMIEGQQEMITLLANISKNLALAQYDGGENQANAVHIIEGKDITNPDEWKTKSGGGNTYFRDTDCNPFEEKCSDSALFENLMN